MEASVNQSELTIRTVLDANELIPVDAVGVLCSALAVGPVSGPWDVAASVFVLAVAATAGGPLTFVITRPTVVSLFGDADLIAVGGVQLAAFPLLASVAYGWPPDHARLTWSAAGYVVALGVTWALWSTLRWTWQATAVAAALAAAVIYGIHRYERVALGPADVPGAER